MMRPPNPAPAPNDSVVSRFGRQSKLAVTDLRSMYGSSPFPNVMSDANAPAATPTRNRSYSGSPSPLQVRTPVGPTGGERPQAPASRSPNPDAAKNAAAAAAIARAAAAPHRARLIRWSLRGAR